MNQKNKRYRAMQKYFSYEKVSESVAMEKPFPLHFENDNYICFCNGYSIILSKEKYPDMKLYEGNPYPQIETIISSIRELQENEYDISSKLKEAAEQGYKFKKSETGNKFQYLLQYDGAYFKIGILDSAYRIIDNGKNPLVYKKKEKYAPLIIKNDIGICIILPLIAYENSTKIIIN